MGRKCNITPVIIETRSRADGLGRQVHVRCLETDNYYLISENSDDGETLCFPSTVNGGIVDYSECAGGGGGYTAADLLADWAEGKLWIVDEPDCDGDQMF